jgi:hypothetical protein
MNRLELYLKDLKDCFLPGRTLPSIGDDEKPQRGLASNLRALCVFVVKLVGLIPLRGSRSQPVDLTAAPQPNDHRAPAGGFSRILGLGFARDRYSCSPLANP